MGKTKRISVKTPDLKNLALGAIHETLKNGISEKGEKECAYFAGLLLPMQSAWLEYRHELSKVDTSSKAIRSNIHPLAKGKLTREELIKIEMFAELHLKMIDRSYKAMDKILADYVKMFDTLTEEAQNYCFDATGSN
jgi:hypothetical protein